MMLDIFLCLVYIGIGLCIRFSNGLIVNKHCFGLPVIIILHYAAVRNELIFTNVLVVFVRALAYGTFRVSPSAARLAVYCTS